MLTRASVYRAPTAVLGIGLAISHPSSPMNRAAYVLVVEDDAQIRDLLSSVFDELGYRVRIAANGQAALEIARTARPLLAVLDYMMPGWTGIDTAVELRRCCGDELPLILMSAAAIPHRELERLDAYLLVPKPFELDQLAQAVEAAASRQQPQPLIDREEPGVEEERAG